MLGQASRRSLLRDGIKQAPSGAEAIQLPFLCPALFTRRYLSKTAVTTTSQGACATSTSKRRKPSLSRQQSNLLRQQRRELASAALAHEAVPDDYVPFEGLQFPLEQLYMRHRPDFTYALPGLSSGQSPLILDRDPGPPPSRFKSRDGISGDLNEIHQTLHACLQVGRFERAQALLRRLKEIYKPDAAGLITAHNDFIREATLRIMQRKDHNLLRVLQHWFEVEVRMSPTSPNATTYALMIQAASRGPNPKARGRGIRRYIHLAKEASLLDETLALVSELDDSIETALQELEQNQPPTAPTASGNSDSPSVSVASWERPISAIRAVEQKGLGLTTLKKQLLELDNISPQDAGPSAFMQEVADGSGRKSPHDRQLALEKNTLDAAVERWREEDALLRSHGILNVLSTKSMGAIMWRWHSALVPSIREELAQASEAESKETRNRTDKERLQWGPYIQDLSPERLSALSILACVKDVSLLSKDDRGVRVLNVVNTIGATIQEECVVKYEKVNKKYSQWHSRSQERHLKGLGASLPKIAESSDKSSSRYLPQINEGSERVDWPSPVRIHLGAFLLSKVVDNAKIEVSRVDPKSGAEMREEQPAFFHTYTYMAGKRIGVIRLNPALAEIMVRAPLSPALAKHLPMICEPKPWTGFKEGGYLNQPLPVVRLGSADVLAKRYALTASKNGDMSQVFAGLNVLAKTPWKINREVLEVMVDAWNSGKEVAKIPPENPEIEIPPEPEPSAPFQERGKWLRAVKEAENYKAGLKSQRCFLNFQLEVARAYLNETLYFPHNVDFRGRAYPMAPFLNHMGADNARGLLQFAEKKILGPSGLRWLKIHLANVYGFDKASLDERQKFTEDHVPDIIDAATHGIQGNRWWLSAEDPWQCLAACIDLKAALELPDPTRYRSRLAIHQDGTCNGLQHYAALGGDVSGAKQVNLEPGDRPSDIYTAVAEMIKDEIKQDAKGGHLVAQHLEGKLTRKVVKQTVMTNVYGVTFVGAKRQVRKQLDALLNGFPDERTVNKGLAASYIAKKIFKSLATMFNGAHDIQYWFGDCAGRICNSLSPEQVAMIERETKGGTPPQPFIRKPIKQSSSISSQTFTNGVIWTTPLKMPVVQSYSKMKPSKVDTSFQAINLHNPSSTDPIHRAKQLQAFPPNFIHSLDGTHMFLTALKCDAIGLAFAAVHDSFWTHAGDVDTMNQITREAFIRMHSENIIERLRTEFEKRYKDHMCLVSVPSQSAAAKQIRAWRKANGMRAITSASSKHKGAELLLEVERLRLLASKDPTQRERGAAMVTAGSTYANSGIEDRIFTPPSEMPVLLGQASTRRARLKADEKLQVGDVENAAPAETVLGSSPASAGKLEDDEDEGSLVEHSLGGEAQYEPISDAAGELQAEHNSDPPRNTPDSTSKDEPNTAWAREAHERKRERSRAANMTKKKTYVWVPLTFPPVPKKVMTTPNPIEERSFADCSY